MPSNRNTGGRGKVKCVWIVSREFVVRHRCWHTYLASIYMYPWGWLRNAHFFDSLVMHIIYRFFETNYFSCQSGPFEFVQGNCYGTENELHELNRIRQFSMSSSIQKSEKLSTLIYFLNLEPPWPFPSFYLGGKPYSNFSCSVKQHSYYQCEKRVRWVLVVVIFILLYCWCRSNELLTQYFRVFFLFFLFILSIIRGYLKIKLTSGS